MSKYKSRKTILFTNIGRFAGTDIRDVQEEDLYTVRALIMSGYLMYDECKPGMILRITSLGEEVLSRE